MRAMEGGHDGLQWECVRGKPSQVCRVLVGTISVARRLRVGRTGGRRFAAMRKRGVLFVEKSVSMCHYARSMYINRSI